MPRGGKASVASTCCAGTVLYLRVGVSMDRLPTLSARFQEHVWLQGGSADDLPPDDVVANVTWDISAEPTVYTVAACANGRVLGCSAVL